MENKSYSDSLVHWKWLKGKQVFVACSGGVDSVFLIHMLLELQVKVEVLHVNYQLRENESFLDQQFVAELCNELGIQFHLNSIDSKSILAQKHQNLQQFARDYRYHWFQEVQSKNPGSFIALGHHSDDQVETFFLQLARNTGIMGLSGMLPRNGIFIRPLLNFSKLELYTLAKSRKLSWREDSSNQSLKYARNKLRNEIVPFLYTNIPELKESILYLMSKFQSTQLVVEKKVQGIVLKIKANKKWMFSDFDVFESEERIEILRNLGVAGNQLSVLNKLRAAQKGAKRIIDELEFIREEDCFSINDKNLKHEYELSLEAITELPTVFDKSIVYFDSAKIEGELFIRTWKIGDRMKKIGLKGTALISDVLTDAKIPHSKRKDWPVVCDSSGILWCYKCAVSEKAIAKSESNRILKLQIIERVL